MTGKLINFDLKKSIDEVIARDLDPQFFIIAAVTKNREIITYVTDEAFNNDSDLCYMIQTLRDRRDAHNREANEF